ncbi:MAG: replicative DNA helicase [Bdellovibrionales bacterium]|nr:replicative DNA helicase [Bdellovibrionales bacterium]
MRDVLPSNLESERALLGILLMGEEEDWDEIADYLKPEDFFQPAHKTIFSHIKELYKKGQSSDPITVANSLKNNKELEQVGGTGYLSDLIHKLASKANIKAYAKITLEKSTLRKIIKKSEDFIEKAYKEDYKKIEHLMDYLESEIFKLNNRNISSELTPVHNLVESGIKKLEDLFHKKISITGLSSSFPELDHITSGFQNSELIILAARPSMGKSALSLNFALHNALQKKTVAFFSLEMSKESILMRLLSALSHINLSQVMSGQIQEKRWSDLINAAGQLSSIPLFIDDSSPLSPYEIRTKSRRLKAKHGLDLIVVDYLQLMQLPEKTESREREVSEMSRLLKSFAKELQIPILTLSQLNRGVESRSDRRPILSDLRESGAIEQDADLIMMLYRDGYYNKSEDEGEENNLAEVIINKHRNGPTGTVHLKWLPDFGTFMNHIPGEPSSPQEGPPF